MSKLGKGAFVTRYYFEERTGTLTHEFMTWQQAYDFAKEKLSPFCSQEHPSQLDEYILKSIRVLVSHNLPRDFYDTKNAWDEDNQRRREKIGY